MNDEAMRVYLSDHLAGARMAMEVVRRRLDRGDGPAWLGTFLDDLEHEISLIEGLAEAYGGTSLPKEAMGWLAQKAGEVKLEVDAAVGDDLRDLLELELVRTGVEGKRCLYRTLEALSGDDDRIAALDPAALSQQAAGQAEVLEQHRLGAAAAALAGR